jgi:hypothetical protein
VREKPLRRRDQKAPSASTAPLATSSAPMTTAVARIAIHSAPREMNPTAISATPSSTNQNQPRRSAPNSCRSSATGGVPEWCAST